MDTCGKVLLIAGSSFLAGAAVQSYVENRNREQEAAARKQRKMEDRLMDQQEEIDRLKRNQKDVADKLNKADL